MRGLFLAALLAVAAPVVACTTFCMNVNGHAVFGANYDWDTGIGMVMVNKRWVTKQSLTGRPVHWMSQYASITLNQYGREFPTGGMNEAGLVIALMGLDVTQYPAVDSRPSTGILDWIQYQLDVSATIDDVVAHAQQIRIAQGGKGLHYLIADRSGRALTLEYLSGQLVTHQDSALPVAVLTNNTCDESIAYLRTITGFGGHASVPSGIGSLERLARAASLMRTTSASADAVERAFAILDSVHQPDYTRWTVVYDPADGTIYFRTDRNPEMRFVSFSSFDLGCSSPVKMLDINGEGTSDVAPLFADYTTAANMALVNTAYDETPFLAGATEDDRIETALHPESDVCTAIPRRRSARH